MNNTLVIYVHGKGGNADESEHYKKLFADCDVAGFDYKSETPWDFKEEFLNWAEEKFCGYKSVILVANSIGAYFSMNAICKSTLKLTAQKMKSLQKSTRHFLSLRL